MGELLTERTPLVIASEINTIKYQTGKILLTSAIEVGRRLKEAKGLLPHGEWLNWLEESVNYTERTAQTLLRIFDAYGSQQLASADAASLNAQDPNADSLNTASRRVVPSALTAQAQAQPILNYTQALILLGVPEEERAQFIAELDLESMTTRELQKTVQERCQVIEERDLAVREKGDLSMTLEDQKEQIDRMAKELASLKSKAQELSKSHAEAMAKAERLSLELKSQKQNTSAKALTRMTNNLTAAYHKAKANRIAFLYESMDRNFKDLLSELKEFEDKEPDTYEVYKKKIVDFLTDGLKGQM
ncbi:Protein of unknown function (DUF3102) [Desulfitobacterium dichloroeliminans LMG P-21439]|uniref:Membrane-bound metallopeptidase n=1 Tax=Desulfitobacterium dichloroeliminans (strain LMG P-21439 / DCA1) TaxID=871963 RepID=L0F2K9_DESDL|nr:DUF3102 domain-containing protein [Desulfitobacterium dichloroeliminans]AGA68059.1 Protein of unknown function (DUF3102) [Desulfitobacterium dichloroeliminans LMG P-21439]